jgi:hypothetical protein
MTLPTLWKLHGPLCFQTLMTIFWKILPYENFSKTMGNMDNESHIDKSFIFILTSHQLLVRVDKFLHSHE